MARVNKSVLVSYSAQQMFVLVENVEDYPKFLPWCGGAAILDRTPQGPLVRIDINYHGVRAHFTTANKNKAPDCIIVELRDGPFRVLDGTWQFRGLSDAACKIEFELHYEFNSHVLEKLIGPVFSHIANSFIDAFVKRAEQIYGPG